MYIRNISGCLQKYNDVRAAENGLKKQLKKYQLMISMTSCGKFMNLLKLIVVPGNLQKMSI